MYMVGGYSQGGRPASKGGRERVLLAPPKWNPVMHVSWMLCCRAITKLWIVHKSLCYPSLLLWRWGCRTVESTGLSLRSKWSLHTENRIAYMYIHSCVWLHAMCRTYLACVCQDIISVHSRNNHDMHIYTFILPSLCHFSLPLPPSWFFSRIHAHTLCSKCY